ncbi:MAG TPA: hypothetical protein VLC46_02175 [Thermoanaerobaculia bacterium]|nr:hypothetical protein [Thermoanaerobaculia bacterium]
MLLLLLAFCAQSPAPERPAAEEPPIIDRSRPQERIAALPVLDAMEAVDAVYRLLPDRRVLLAVRDVYELHTGQVASVDVDFRNGGWEIHCANHLAGRLPELPQFGEDLAMLSSWSHALGPPPTTLVSPRVSADSGRLVESFSPPFLIAAMRSLSLAAGGGPLGADVLRLAARASVDLNVQMTDSYGVGDAITARALALVAMARDADPRFGDEEATLLADEMGYTTEAREMALRFPVDSVALIVTGVMPPRRDLSGANARLAYLSARRLVIHAGGNDRIESIAPFIGRLRARALPLLLQNNDFSNAVSAAHCVEALVVDDVTGAGFADKLVTFGGTSAWLEEAQAAIPAAKSEAGALVSQYESSRANYARDAASRLLGSDAIRGFYDAIFYSALDSEFAFYRSRLAEQGATNEFLQSVGTTSSETGRDVRAVMRAAAANTFEGGRGVEPQAIVGWNHVGGAARANTLIALNSAHGGDQSVHNAAVAFFAVLDSRPQQMLSAGRIALAITADPSRRDRYMGTAFRRSPIVADEGIQAWFYYLTGDVSALRMLAGQRSTRRADRAVATDYVGRLGDAAFADRNFESLLAESYEGVYPIYAGWLNSRHEWQAKERAARHWLAVNAGHDSIEDAYYASSLADALEHQGRYDEAWKTVEPHIDVWSENIVEKAVSLLQRRGQVEKANALGRAMIERYPGASSRSGLAVVLWREKRWQDAAALFDPKLARYSRSEWTASVPDDFASACEKSDVTTVSAAMDALLDAGIDSTYLLMSIPEALRKIGRADLAFAVAERACLRHPLKENGDDGVYEHVIAYTMLAAAKGDREAIDWLRSQTPDALVMRMAMTLYQTHQFGALFAVSSPRPLARKNIELQVYLVAALTQLRVAKDDPRFVALRNDVATQAIDPNSLQGITRYLLGMTDEKTFIAWGKSLDGRCNVEYFIGLKSASEGNYDRALRAIVAATYGPYGSVPQVWAENLLGTWNNQRGTWPEVARRAASE